VYVTGNSLHYVFTKVERATKGLKEKMPHERDSIKSVSTHRFTLELVGANPKPELVKQEGNAYYENYYLAHCPNGVVAHSYEKFTLKGVYPGVDWVVYTNGQGLKYDFVLAKGSDASKIRLKVKDADATLNAEGNLVMNTSLGKVVEDKPVSFQEGQKLETSFKELGNQTFGFTAPNASLTQPLTIDPSVAWATYYGGSDYEDGRSCAIDATGNVYLAGRTSSTNFPVAGAYQGTFAGGIDGDAFLVKFNSTGSRVWATYYGGSNTDNGKSCATDATGNVYLAGYTFSTNFPVAGAFQGTFGGTYDAFLLKFNSIGSRLWATYYGGSDRDNGRFCVTDASSNVYLAGFTYSNDFPVVGAFQGTIGGGVATNDAFLVKFNSTGSRLWATYYGGSESDDGTSCTTDAVGNVYLAGFSSSINFPVAGAFQGMYGGGVDAFLVKFNSTGSRLWATYYGGSNDDYGYSCATDAAGNVYLAGASDSINLPLAGAFQGTNGGLGDAFLVKFNSTGSRLWATYYGGSDQDYGFSCATDTAGDVYLAGTTYSINFPVAGAFQGTNGGNWDAFLVKFNSIGSRLWATYYGGTSDDYAYSFATDAAGNVYMAGYTNSTNFPVEGAFQGTNGGGFDAFMVKFDSTTTTALVNNYAGQSLNLFPNPASTSVQLNLSYGDIKQVDVIDQLGRTLITTKEVVHNTLDISSLAAGTYMVRVLTTDGVTFKKMVKQ
jgi:hypothetical protein